MSLLNLPDNLDNISIGHRLHVLNTLNENKHDLNQIWKIKKKLSNVKTNDKVIPKYSTSEDDKQIDNSEDIAQNFNQPFVNIGKNTVKNG